MMRAHDDILMEWEGGAFPVLTRRWVHSNVVDEPVGFETYTASGGVGSGTEHAMYADRQGSVLWVTDPATGEVAAGYEYDGYGAITQTQGALQQPYGYTGREFDAESGLYYYRARSYDPETGMFVQSDPIGFGGGTLGLYTIGNNNSFNWSDPTGLLASSEVGVVATGMALSAGSFMLINSGTVDLTSTILFRLRVSKPGDNTFASAQATNGGNNTDPECLRARARKEAAERRVEKLGECTPAMGFSDLFKRYHAMREYIFARHSRDAICHAGEDEWHMTRLKEHISAMRKCGMSALKFGG